MNAEKTTKAIRSLADTGKAIGSRIKLIIGSIAIVAFGLGLYWFNSWSQYNIIHVQSPFRTPVYITKVEMETLSPIAKPKHEPLTKDQMLQQATNAEVLNKVNILETTKGKAENGLGVYCADRDMSNEFGFDPFNKHCFNSFADSVAIVDQYFTDLFTNGMSLEQALCYYNTGLASSACDYSQAYKEL